MTTLQFLHSLKKRQIRLWLDGEKLCFKGAEESMTPELMAELRQRRLEIVNFLKQIKDDPQANMPPIQRAPRDKALPLSFSQQRLWFLDQLDPGVPMYNIYDAIEIKKTINIEALQCALTEMVRRHEILRTTFPSVAGVPVQVIAPPSAFCLSVVDLSDLLESDRKQQAEQLRREEAKRPFDMTKGPLLRVKLLRFAHNHYLWLLTIHHIITDDWSKKLFDQELDILYIAFCQGLPSPLPELPIQYADFAVWQREWLQGPVMESRIEYWAEHLKGDLPILEMPTDRPRCQSFRGTTGRFTCSRTASMAIKKLSECENATPFMTLVAAYSALLSRYTGQEDILIGSSISDRNQVETEQLIGFLLNTLVLRTRLNGNPTFREVLKQVRETCVSAHAHQEVPYAELLQRLRVNRDLPGSPLFQTMLDLLNTPSITKSSTGFWAADSFVDDGNADLGTYERDENNGTTKFDLSITFVEEGQVYRGTTEYNTDLFDHETIVRLLQRFQALLLSAAANPEQRISELSLMREEERQALLMDSNGPAVSFSKELCLHQLFEAQVERTPDAIAIEFKGEKISYAVLNSQANRLAHFLKKVGAGPETIVGICVERAPEMVMAQLAVLKTGAAYLPLDPTYPQQRLAFMLQDALVNIVVAQQHLLPILSGYPASIICLEVESEQIAAESSEDLVCLTSAMGQVCVLYTSGSTGLAKGVILTHEALVNYTLATINAYGLAAGDRVLQFASMSFDVSMDEIYPCLSQGATLVLRTDQMLDSIRTFLLHCQQLGITLLLLPTAYWHEIISQLHIEENRMPPNLRLVVIGGEKAMPAKLSVWQKFVTGRITLVNAYGPTEGTITVTRCTLPGFAGGEAANNEVPIGYPIENTCVYLLDRWMQLVPIGIPGKLHIGGVALARGYLNRANLTAEKFLPDPLSREPGARLYDTGDLVRLLPTGILEYRGRTDQQIKIRGFRIELGEIQSILEKHELVKDAVVMVREDDPGLTRIVAYLVLRKGSEPTIDDLHTFLKQFLPNYMLPAAFVFLQKLPLNSNGKVDYSALPKPVRTRADFNGKLVGPRTPTEEALESIWTSVLKLDRIGIYENFFELGGHSLLATQVVSRISEVFHIDMPLRRLFELSTIAELSIVVDQLVQTGSKEKPRIVSVRGLMNDPFLLDAARPSNAHASSSFQKQNVLISVADPNTEQMLAALDGLSEQEVNALLGEDQV